MKIYIDCNCVLLQKSIEVFLADYVSDFQNCDFVVTDDKIFNKPTFNIGKFSPYIDVPFTPKTLIDCIDSFNVSLKKPISNQAYTKSKTQLELKIDNLFDEFKQKLLTLLKEHNNA